MYNTIVVGGGPAGMMAAIKAAENNKQVVLLEKNKKLGKKLYITGKGRCNLTNDSDVENHLNHLTVNKKFMYSAYYSFDSYMTMDFFNKLGLPTKVERGQRVFPLSEKSSDVIKAFKKALDQLGVDIYLNTDVKHLIIEDGIVKGVKTNHKDFYAEHVILATGGKSYEMTGSDGYGYQLAAESGHQLINPIQGLVPMETFDTDIRALQGLSLRHVKLSLYGQGKKALYDEVGEMLFTHFGITGPLVLSASSYIPRNTSFKNLRVIIDLKPGLDERKLDKRVLRDMDKYPKKALKNGLVDLMPSSLIPIIIKRAGLKENMAFYELTKEERLAIVNQLKSFTIRISKLRTFNEAIITRGGVSVKDVDPHTMESKIISRLYFAGEMLDVDAMTGGFNLQIAYSTANLAGMTVGEKG